MLFSYCKICLTTEKNLLGIFQHDVYLYETCSLEVKTNKHSLLTNIYFFLLRRKFLDQFS